eukprot:TRINITY_DN5428_c0_g1_i1.p1 TRINITY_DN5428_c0_g1~~TRINITY_DN5428_c0_g1_i1.p1  ORF type:complete len:133 (+),score=13.67 TRINITY_DN5428_c0_g1_i1:114-512(+)
MHGQLVVNQHQVSLLPGDVDSMSLHELHCLLHKLVINGRLVSQTDSLLGIISLVNPTGVCCHKLVVVDFLACTIVSLDRLQNRRGGLEVVSFFQPFPLITRFLELLLNFLFLVGLVGVLPSSSNSRGRIIIL